MTDRPKTNPELDRALATIAALPKHPLCPRCKGVVEAEWWSYCASCGYHIAYGYVIRDGDGETAPQKKEG